MEIIKTIDSYYLSLGFAPKVLEANVHEQFSGENIFLEEEEGDDNYWLADPDLSGKDAFISLDLRQYKNVTGFKIKNTKNGKDKNWGTKDFTIFENEVVLLSDQLADIQEMEGEVPTIEVSFDSPRLIRFIKFQIDSFYGQGGGLQYFSVEGNTLDMF